VLEHLRDLLDAFAVPVVEFADDDRGSESGMSNVAGRDDIADNPAQPANHIVRTEFSNELRDSLNAILQWNYSRVWSNDWPDCTRCVRHLPRFNAEHNQIRLSDFRDFCDVVSRLRGIDNEIAAGAIDSQSVRLDRAQVLTASNERDVLAGLRQPSAEVSAHTTSPKDSYSH
jgi:hypothetical protein